MRRARKRDRRVNAAIRGHGDGRGFGRARSVFNELQLDVFAARFGQRECNAKRRADEMCAKRSDVARGYAHGAQSDHLAGCSADADQEFRGTRIAAVERRPGVRRQGEDESDDGGAEHVLTLSFQ